MPATFHSPPYFLTSWAYGSFLGLLAVLLIVATGLQTLYLSIYTASRPKKEPGISNTGLNGFVNGEAYTSEAKSWRDTQLRAGSLQGAHGGSLCFWAEGQVCNYRGK